MERNEDSDVGRRDINQGSRNGPCNLMNALIYNRNFMACLSRDVYSKPLYSKVARFFSS